MCFLSNSDIGAYFVVALAYVLLDVLEMRSSKLVTGTARPARVPVARASKRLPVISLASPLLFVGAALADTPSFESLSRLSYDDAIAPSAKAAAKVAKESAVKAAEVNLNGIEDATPLIAGLAFGIALVGGAIYFIANANSGGKIKVRDVVFANGLHACTAHRKIPKLAHEGSCDCCRTFRTRAVRDMSSASAFRALQ
jgi:hypothetical protein